MPNNMIKKDEKRGYGSEKKLENDWDEAKDAAGKKPGGGQNYALTNYIYQKKKKHKASASIRPMMRLLATAEPEVDGAPPTPEEYKEDIWNAEGMNGSYVQGEETMTELAQWMAHAKIKHKINPGAAFAICAGSPAEVTKALVAAGWVVDPRTKHLKCDEHELYVSAVNGTTIVTDLAS